MMKVQNSEAPWNGPATDGCELSVSALHKSFLSPAGDIIEVLRGVDFSARPGESLAIVGASGAGKSTLLHLLGGLESLDRGAIRLNGISVELLDRAALANLRNKRIGFIFQFHHLLTDLSAIENVALPLMISGSGRREALNRAGMALEQVGLGDRVNHLISYLSGGEQQRVALCRALINEPDLVLADEPTGNLDSSIELEISSLLVTYARKRRGILVVATHNQRLASMCDRVLMLKDGKLDGA